MSLTQAAPAPRPSLRQIAVRAAIAGAAVAAVAGGLALLAWLAGLGGAPPPAPKNPFGAGPREAGAPAEGFGAWIMAAQAQFNRAMISALEALRRDGAAVWPLAGLGFLYGVFHAAGPGHGKGVITAYLLAGRKTLFKGLSLAFAAALLQAVVAIAVISLLAGVLGATRGAIETATDRIELASFAAIAVLGAVLLWRKTEPLARGADDFRPPPHAPARHDAHPRHDHDHHEHHHHAHDHADGEHCGHVHIPGPAAIAQARDWRETAAVVAAAGMRPCSGALILLVFALSQGVYAAGIFATLAMALGTALTTGALAALAVFGKSLAVRIAGSRGTAAARAVSAIELLAAAFVLVLGTTLLIGLVARGAGGA